MTYEEYGVWLERHVADCSDGEGRSMLKMCLSNFKDSHAVPVNDVGEAGLREKLDELILNSPCTPTAHENTDFKNEVQRILCEPTPTPVASGLKQGLEDIDWMACQAMKEYDGVDIAKVPKVYHGYRAILVKVDGLKRMLSHPTPSSQAEKVDGGLMEKVTALAYTNYTHGNLKWVLDELKEILSHYSKEAK